MLNIYANSRYKDQLEKGRKAEYVLGVISGVIKMVLVGCVLLFVGIAFWYSKYISIYYIHTYIHT